VVSLDGPADAIPEVSDAAGERVSLTRTITLIDARDYHRSLLGSKHCIQVGLWADNPLGRLL